MKNYRNSVIVLADMLYTRKGESQIAESLHSRMFLLCKSGEGLATINGIKYSIKSGDFKFLPWMASYRFSAAANSAVSMAVIHIIPNHSRLRKVEFRAVLNDTHPLAKARYRQNLQLPWAKNILGGSTNNNKALEPLVDYITESFHASTGPDERTMRTCASLLLNELSHVSLTVHQDTPPVLTRLIHYIDRNLHNKISMPDLVDFSGISASSVGRLFTRHRKMSPVEWISYRKMVQAKKMLSTTPYTINSIGERLAMKSPGYFSKRFKRCFGYSPKHIRMSDTKTKMLP